MIYQIKRETTSENYDSCRIGKYQYASNQRLYALVFIYASDTQFSSRNALISSELLVDIANRSNRQYPIKWCA